MPAWIDLPGHAGKYLAAGWRGTGLDREAPLHLIAANPLRDGTGREEEENGEAGCAMDSHGITP